MPPWINEENFYLFIKVFVIFLTIIYLIRYSYEKFLSFLTAKILARYFSNNKTWIESKTLDVGLWYLTRDTYSIGIDSKWPKIGNLPVDKLPMHDISEEIKANSGLRHPLGTTNFLKEIGWVPRSSSNGKSDTRRNFVIYKIIKPLECLMTCFKDWKTTSSYSKDTYKTVQDKIDKAPCEDHKHYKRMWNCYRAISDYILKQCPSGLQRLSDEKVIETTNKKGSIGYREKELIGRYSDMGKYIKAVEEWKFRVGRFKVNLLRGQPINPSFETSPKREVKTTPRGRLIWSLCPTARIYENQIFGHLDTLLKELPYSISGVPQHYYGDTLSRTMRQIGPRVRAVCDDVSGWDTKVSYSILCMEAAFLQSLTTDQRHKDEIRAMYGLYAYPLVWIDRPFLGTTQKVLYRLQGQVASGRRVTYAMNTITNIVVTMSRAAYSQRVLEDDMYAWTLDKLQKGHSDCYGGKISGDDSVIMMSEENAVKFATKGKKFMNDIGMPRKHKKPNEDSNIHRYMSDIEFCSHRYSLIEFEQAVPGEKILKRWMPRRGLDEILAKASIVKNDKIESDDVAWARAQALTLLVQYFHMPTVRLVALAILSATPNDCIYDHLPKNRDRKPWIQEGDVLEIINNWIIGSKKRQPFTKLTDLAKFSVKYGPAWEPIYYKSDKYIDWKKTLIARVKRLRSSESHYDDWLPGDWVERSWWARFFSPRSKCYTHLADNPV